MMRLILAFLLAWLSLPAMALERITSFDSVIEVQSDSSLVVTETITVVAEGRDIRRGIYRDFPTDYTADDGSRVRAGFEVLSVKRDNAKESYHTERLQNGVRVYMGRKDRMVTPGVHVYELRYRTTRQLGFFDDHDELYWNVTGNDWAFAIERARALVVLPGNVKPTDTAYYTGPQGARGKDATAYGSGSGVMFETTRTLGVGEGLTIVVAWPKGYVTPPSPTSELLYGGRKPQMIAGAGGLALILTYYIVVWWRVGRDPVGGPIYPRYEPPKNIAPAAMRYVARMGYDHKAFAAALVSMAVKGAIKLNEDDRGVFTVVNTGAGENLSPGEKAVRRVLFSAGEPAITLKQSEHALVRRAIAALKERLSADYERVYFLTNRKWLIPGVALSLLVLAVMALLSAEPAGALFLSVWVGGWSAGCYLHFTRIKAAWSVVGNGGSLLHAVGLTLFFLPFLFGLALGIGLFAQFISVIGAVLTAVVVVINLLFVEWMKAPTSLGRKVLDEVEGFRLYLTVAEQGRLDFAHAPERTPELFEKYLPFAMALDVETRWGEKFADVLQKAMAERNYHPRWYAGHSFSPQRFGAFPASLGASVASAVASASQAPGSSSGFGGGGGSGGGGGGGGGGGW